MAIKTATKMLSKQDKIVIMPLKQNKALGREAAI